MKVKDLGQSATKWVRRAGAAAGDYRDGVQNPKTDWQGATQAAEEAYETGVTAAISRKAFGKGVSKAGTGKWQDGAMNKGASRYGPGVSMAKDDWFNGFGPYAAVLAGLTLDPRGARGSPQNYARVQQIGDALHKKRIGG